MADLCRDYSRFVVSKKPEVMGRFTIHSMDDCRFIIASHTNRRKLQEMLRQWKKEQVDRLAAVKRAIRSQRAKKAWNTRRQRETERKLAA